MWQEALCNFFLLSDVCLIVDNVSYGTGTTTTYATVCFALCQAFVVSSANKNVVLEVGQCVARVGKRAGGSRKWGGGYVLSPAFYLHPSCSPQGPLRWSTVGSVGLSQAPAQCKCESCRPPPPFLPSEMDQTPQKAQKSRAAPRILPTAPNSPSFTPTCRATIIMGMHMQEVGTQQIEMVDDFEWGYPRKTLLLAWGKLGLNKCESLYILILDVVVTELGLPCRGFTPLLRVQG